MQWARKQKHQGFTIVELLVVIVVIAILATVVIVSYNGVTNRAKTLALTNSLRNAADEVQIAGINKTVPTEFPSSVKPDKDVVLQLAGTVGGSKDFCINAYRISTYEVGSYDSSTGKMSDYLCPGVLIGSPIGGEIPTTPLSKNLIVPDFSQWKLTGNVSYNKETGELTFNGTTGVAVSPLVYMGGASTSASVSYELYSTGSSVNYAPQAGAYSGSAYYGADGTTAVKSSAGYTSNGNAQAVPLSVWTTRSWTVTTGPNVQYVRFNINLAPSTYTSNNFKVRNPSIERKG